jgi:MFS superfamily sulfate permease-like transporter
MDHPSEPVAPVSPTPESPRQAWKADAISGFLVFLIALPLCLGISTASGFPALAGIITAIVGGVLVTFIGGAPLTIKGPAAGLIVIALGAVTDLGDGVEGSTVGYRRALAVIVVAGVLQAILGVMRAGKLGDFFPSSVVHGMLAAIGIIICSKQLHFVVGVAPTAREPVALLMELPHSFANFNPEVLLIGATSLFILFGWPMIKNKTIKKIPAPLVVLFVAIPLGLLFDLEHEHHYTFLGSDYSVAPRLLVTISGSLASAVTFPDFSHLMDGTSIRYIVMFTLVGSIESLLSAKAIDSLDPQRRKSNLDRDLVGIGVGNAISGLLGGLPMIAEIVRSSANLNNGAKTRMANFFHGVFLLIFVATAPMLIHMIPVAALAAMLAYTGTRLASPAEFARTWKVGREQLLIFVTTMIGCVAVDLLVGVAMGIACKIIIHLVNGAPLRSVFRAETAVAASEETTTISVTGAAVFSNYLGLKGVLEKPSTSTVIVDLSACRVVDHTVMERLHEVSMEMSARGRKLVVRGLEKHQMLSQHPMAARRSVFPPGTSPS